MVYPDDPRQGTPSGVPPSLGKRGASAPEVSLPTPARVVPSLPCDTALALPSAAEAAALRPGDGTVKTVP